MSNAVWSLVSTQAQLNSSRYTGFEDHMAWIKVVDESDADSKLSEAYTKVAAARGRVANILKVHSIHPEAMTAHLALYRELMFGRSELTRSVRELIAVAVSVFNH